MRNIESDEVAAYAGAFSHDKAAFRFGCGWPEHLQGHHVGGKGGDEDAGSRSQNPAVPVTPQRHFRQADLADSRRQSSAPKKLAIQPWGLAPTAFTTICTSFSICLRR